MRTLCRNITEIFPGRRLLVVMGLLKDKPMLPVLRAWAQIARGKGQRPKANYARDRSADSQTCNARFLFAAPPSERARPAFQLAQAARRFGYLAHAFDSPAEAFTTARESCGDEDLLCVTGSHYLIGALMKDKLLPPPY
jgi:folylpolyglutamate synthase/dihydropteroate synthase